MTTANMPRMSDVCLGQNILFLKHKVKICYCKAAPMRIFGVYSLNFTSQSEIIRKKSVLIVIPLLTILSLDTFWVENGTNHFTSRFFALLIYKVDGSRVYVTGEHILF